MGFGVFYADPFPLEVFFKYRSKGRGSLQPSSSKFFDKKPESQIINTFEISKSFDRSIDRERERERERDVQSVVEKNN